MTSAEEKSRARRGGRRATERRDRPVLRTTVHPSRARARARAARATREAYEPLPPDAPPDALARQSADALLFPIDFYYNGERRATSYLRNK